MTAAKVVRLPCDAASKRARDLEALWAAEDRIWNELKAVREKIRPLQREVSIDRGYMFCVSREALQRPARRARA